MRLHYENSRSLIDIFTKIDNDLIIRGGSRKKMAKKITPSVPTSKDVYTRASIK